MSDSGIPSTAESGVVDLGRVRICSWEKEIIDARKGPSHVCIPIPANTLDRKVGRMPPSVPC